MKNIALTLGVKHLSLSEDPCLTKTLVITQDVLKVGQNSTIRCDCTFNNNNTCHITHFILKTFSLPGRLPPEFSKLRDLCRNYLYGSIPMEWASLPYLTSIGLEANQFSGTIPKELGNLVNLEGFRFSDNRLNGSIPEFIGNLSKLQRLELYASGLTEPIPVSIFRLENLNDLRISDTTAGLGQFPHITSKNLKFLYASSQKRELNRTNPNHYLESSKSHDSNQNSSMFRHKQLSKLSLHIKCGGPDVTIENSRGKFLYEGDDYGVTGSATTYHGKNWGFSNTGDFMDDAVTGDIYTVSSEPAVSAKHPELYKTARRSPLSLAYFAFCFENGSYNVKLHFAEIQFSDEEPYARLARRLFNIYVQGKLVWEDFSIREEANGTHKEVIKEVNTTVTDNTLEIRLYWAGKGTTVLNLNVAYKCRFFLQSQKKTNQEHIHSFSVLRQLKAATDDFDPLNKIGEGGFGSVYKGRLPDGTLIAVKKLSSKSCQGNKEFVNEIGIIACLQHPNLVKLYGCCCENNQLLLVYEYLENNCLADALFGKAFVLQKKGDFAAILDSRLEGVFDVMEAERMIKVSLLCSNKSPTLRPTMSEVVRMLEGEAEIEQVIADPGVYRDESRFKRPSEMGTSSFLSEYIMSIPSSCESTYDLYPRSPESIVFSRP
ncbi:unnamed protein product [Thlaspi arvense]|uniref:non-specific serine/threonine protein kinase n=1 Tax=Thlaspi arvense TaxID=13288 RepID=A0AAU9R659_THLAR|nr:unnamed protein product [Thlaspi arvense]